jgi:hypothetical protein
MPGGIVYKDHTFDKEAAHLTNTAQYITRIFTIQVYEHPQLSGVPWLIITGSGLDGFIGTSITITTDHNQLMSKTRSIPYWTTSVFSFHYDRLGSDLHIGPLRIIKDEWTQFHCPFITSRPTEYRSPPQTVHLLLRLFIATDTFLESRCLAMDYSASTCCRGHMLTKLLSSNGHIHHNISLTIGKCNI